MNIIKITIFTMLACTVTWIIGTFKKTIIDFFIMLIEDVERINKILSTPEGIKARYLLFNMIAIMTLIAIMLWSLIKTGTPHWINALALLFAVATLFFLQYKRDNSNM